VFTLCAFSNGRILLSGVLVRDGYDVLEFVLIRLTVCALSGVKKISFLNGCSNFKQFEYK
jgi:hypothetical protein